MTSKVALLEKLGQAEDTLNRLKARYFQLRAFQDQLEEILGRRKADILNDHVWTMVFDTRDALAMHLTSWSKGMAGRGGLFGHLNSNRGALHVRKPKSGQDDSVHRREAFERLFPGAVERNKVIEADVNQVTDRFIAILARVRNDRSKTLAHIFERDAQLRPRSVDAARLRPSFHKTREDVERPSFRNRRLVAFIHRP